MTLFTEPFLSRWVFDVEIVARYINQVGSPLAGARRIYEYPLHVWKDVRGSKVKALDFGKAFLDVVRIYWRYRRHSHRKEQGAYELPTNTPPVIIEKLPKT